ncbi:sodium transport system permease protein [Alteromonadaceae bacterium Bs31]|nr:sodium transport system permease protein [Alteromonadaceae bacterium Bs31]
MQWLIVTMKEMKDNIRDKRSFFFAVVYGPIFMPLLLIMPMMFGAKANIIDYQATSDVMVLGREYAPNLVAHLKKNNLNAIDAPAEFKQQIQEGLIKVVLEIPEGYGQRLRTAKPALLTLYTNQSSKDSQKSARHIRSIIESYSGHLGYWRMRARGFDHDVTQVIKVVEQDLSSEGLSGMIFGFLTYFVIVLTMMTGGFYLAIDISAGERERSSLEPLLALPMSRHSIVIGKYLAVLCFVTFSSLLATIVMYLLFTFLPFGEISNFLDLSGTTLLRAFIFAFPCCFVVASLLTATAAFTKSTKEAQTYISILYILPMIPMLLGQAMDIKSSSLSMLIPFFSQYTLIDKTVKNESISMEYLAASFSGSLIVAGLLLFAAIYLYRQEKILGN